jgi:NADPH2:quinone reductase
MPAKCVCRLPDAISFETGAAMMLKGLTAQYLLKKTLPAEGLQPGDFVLFHAAAGGVGLIACQWAKALGLQLIGTAGSDEKCKLALDHGAAHAINYTTTKDFAARVREITGGQGVKVVYDSVGKDTFQGSVDSLRPLGLLAVFGNGSGPVPPVNLGVLAKGSFYLTRPTLFTHIATREGTQAMADDLFDVVRSGAVEIAIGQRYALDDVQQAHRDLEARKTTGCTILTL